MQLRDEKNHTITIQDDSEWKPYKVDDFVRIINQLGFLMNYTRTEESPAKLYADSLRESPEKDVEYEKIVKIMNDQLYDSLVGRLKMAHLPVTFPDTVYFAKSYKKIMSSNFTQESLKKAIRADAIAFQRAIALSIIANHDTAKNNNIAIVKDKET